jgi:hypothetical protein
MLSVKKKKEVSMGMVHHSDQTVGTIGGTLIAFIGIVDGNDIIKTGILACVGAIVSFGVSKGLHWALPNPPKGREKAQSSEGSEKAHPDHPEGKI